jgi:large subunit ribosomal protein L7/L12
MADAATMEAPAKNFSGETKSLGDQIANLTLKQAKELSDYLEAEYGIKPAAGGVVVAAGGGGGEGGGPAPVAEKTEFDVVLTGFGDKKLQVVKVVKDLLGVPLMEAKKLVEGVPATLKQGVAKDEANNLKTKIEAEGGSVELK